MRWLKNIYRFLSSQAFTLWFIGIFILYYLTVAVWYKEAFATFINLTSSNTAFRILYGLFFLNVVLRIFKAVHALRKNRYRLILRLPVYAGLLLFLLSFFMSLNVRQHQWLLLGEGDMIYLQWEKDPFQVVKIDPALKKDLLRVDDSIVFDYEPVLTVTDMQRNLYRVGAFPPKRARSTYMHILNFGIGPGVELMKESETVAKGYLALRLIPFGNVDSFEMKPFPYKFYLRILPNDVIKKGDTVARNYNLDRPRYEVEIVKGEKMIAKGSTDSFLSFDGSMSLHFFTPSYWVLLEVAYDPFLLPFAVGIVLLIIGAALSPLSMVKKPAH